MKELNFTTICAAIINEHTFIEEDKDNVILLTLDKGDYLQITYEGNDIIEFETMINDEVETCSFKQFQNEQIEALLHDYFFSQDEAEDNRSQEEIDGFVHGTL